jgi:hypothetical protein
MSASRSKIRRLLRNPFGRAPPTPAKPAYDVAAATVLLNAVGQAIVDDPAYRQAPWEGISLVAELDGRQSMFGYVYRPGGHWEAELPDNAFDVLDKVLELQAAMRPPGGETWKTVLIQLRQGPEHRFHAEFEYDDGLRWRIGPENLEQYVEELRPR